MLVEALEDWFDASGRQGLTKGKLYNAATPMAAYYTINCDRGFTAVNFERRRFKCCGTTDSKPNAVPKATLPALPPEAWARPRLNVDYSLITAQIIGAKSK